ncbi:MAG: hypothetical protein ACRYGP_17635 [Janthinobacterium lividum]
MPYYSWFHGRGQAVLADQLGADDPFGLAPVDIVDRLLAAGYMPAIEHPQEEPFRGLGMIAEVEHDGINYLVSISRDAEEIGLQEWRDDPYDLAE